MSNPECFNCGSLEVVDELTYGPACEGCLDEIEARYEFDLRLDELIEHERDTGETPPDLALGRARARSMYGV